MEKKYNVFVCHFNGKCRNSLDYILKKFDQVIEVIGQCEDHTECEQWLLNNTQTNTDCVLISFPRNVINPDDVMDDFKSKFPDVDFVSLDPFDLDRLSRFYEQIGLDGSSS